MRTETIVRTLYKFDELSEPAKEKAREWYRQAAMEMSWAWEQIQEDSKQIGLKITSLDDRRNNEGEFIGSARDTAKLIIENHGIHCETYQTAIRYQGDLSRLYELANKEESTETETAYENCIHEFLHDLLEDYRIMLNKEIEYQDSNESVDESILANEYEFLESGKRA